MIIMTGQVNKKAGKVIFAYYDFVGEHHLENVCKAIDARGEEVNSIQLPESLDVWFNRHLDRMKKREAFQKLIGNLKTALSRVAIIIMTLVLSMLIITISVDAVRTRVYNLLLDNHEYFTSVRIDEFPDAMLSWEEYYYPKFIPKGFYIQSASELVQTKTIEFINADETRIMFSQTRNGSDHNLDTEGSSKKEVHINGNTAALFESPKMNILFWNDEDFSFCLSSALSPDIIIEMAESVVKK